MRAPSPPYRTALFDLDGTLLDTIDMIVESLREALETHLDGYEPARELLLAGVGTPLVEQLAGHARRRLGREPDPALVRRLVDAYLEHNHAAHDEAVRAFPGVPEMVATLRARGVRLGIVTSKAHEISRRGLRLCGLEAAFEIVVAAEDVMRHKPDPEPVLTALAALGMGPASAIFIGDSPHDLRAGAAAEVATGAAGWGPFRRAVLEAERPTHWLKQPADLLGLTDPTPR